MNLYTLKEKLMEHEKAVFTINEISRILHIKKTVASVYLNRMHKKGLIFRIERRKISLTKDPFIIASQLIYPSFISLTSGLYLHGIIQQVINKIYVLTSVKRKPIKIFGTEIIFINVNPKFIFGYQKIKKENSFIMLADIEKIIIDCLNFSRYCRLNYVIEALKNADIKKLEYYLSLLKKESLNRRVGYLLDILGIKNNIKRKNKTIYKLNPSIKTKGKFNSKWYIYVNDDLK